MVFKQRIIFSTFNIVFQRQAVCFMEGGWMQLMASHQGSFTIWGIWLQSLQRSGNSQETLLQRSLKSSNNEQLYVYIIYMELQRTLYQYLLSSEWQIVWLYWEPNCSGKQPVSIIWSWWNCILRHFEANKKALRQIISTQWWFDSSCGGGSARPFDDSLRMRSV